MRFRDAILVLVLTVAVILLSYGPFLFPLDDDLVLGRMDLWGYFGPAAYLMDQSVHDGEWPQWNPLVFCGTPFAANPQSSLYYPPHVVRSLLNVAPTPMRSLLSLWIMQGVHLLFLALGMFALGRDHRLHRAGALVAALGFAASAVLIHRSVQHWHFIANAAWLPWIVLLLRRGLRSSELRRKLGYGIATGIIFGVTILIGFPQLTIYLGLFVVAYAVLYRVTALANTPRSVAGRQFLSDLLLLLLLFAVAVAIAMPALLPAAEFAAHTARTKEIGVGVATAGPVPINPFDDPRGLLQAILLFPGNYRLRFMGMTGVLLALCALRQKRRRHAVIFLVLFMIFLDCAMGPPFPVAGLVSALAPFRMAGPERAALFACFALAMLAGFGTDALARPRPSRFSPAFWGILLAALGTPLLLQLREWIWPDPVVPVSVAALLLPVFAFAIILLAQRPGWGRYAVWALAAVLAGEIVVWNHAYLPHILEGNRYPGDRNALTRPHAYSAENTRGTAGAYRENTGIYELRPVINGYDPLTLNSMDDFILASGREDTYLRHVSSDTVTRRNQRGNLLLKRRFWLTRSIEHAALPGKGELFAPVAAVIFPEGANNASSLGQSLLEPSKVATLNISSTSHGTGTQLPLPSFTLSGRHSALRLHWRATATGRVELDFTDPESGDSIAGADFKLSPGAGFVEIPLPDFGRVATLLRPYLEKDDAHFALSRAEVYEDAADEGHRIRIRAASANTVDLNIRDLPAPRYLLFTGAHYPGWSVYVDGEKAELLGQANGPFMAVRLTEGSHTVRFNYASATVRLGLIVGLAAGIIALCSVAVLLRRDPARARGGAESKASVAEVEARPSAD